MKKGIVLAGGNGTRLRPLTEITNKHLLPVYDKPMIFYPLETLKQLGITDVLVVTGTESAGDFMKLLGSGEKLGLSLTFRVQDGALGIANALYLGKEFVNEENFAVILGDNIFQENFSSAADSFESGAKIFVKEVHDPERFGVVCFDENKQVKKIVEKPSRPESNFAQTGLYFYDGSVFNIIDTLKPSERGEYEISDVNQVFVERGQMQAEILQGFWKDAGTHESLFVAAEKIREGR